MTILPTGHWVNEAHPTQPASPLYGLLKTCRCWPRHAQRPLSSKSRRFVHSGVRTACFFAVRAAMESMQEKPPESSSFAPGSEEPTDSAREPEVLPPEESEGCARPLETIPKKLCGYLSKFGGKGPIRGWKSRWFFYDEKKCHLYYSRTAQDANPLDSIDLSSAVFDCKADAEEGTFEIKTPGRIITLKVNGAVFLFSARMSSQDTAGRGRVIIVDLLEQ